MVYKNLILFSLSLGHAVPGAVVTWIRKETGAVGAWGGDSTVTAPVCGATTSGNRWFEFKVERHIHPCVYTSEGLFRVSC